MLPAVGAVRPWADPHVVSIGRLDMRPPSPAYESIEAARAAGRPRWRRSLDGRWAFRLFDSPDDVPAAAVVRPPAGGSWTSVAVPGNWTLQGVGDLPQYTNVRMPFPGPPPRLPDRNPTGVYRRTMQVPKRWLGRQVVLHVGGAESTHVLYVNGEFVGYGTDSRLASEYDITPFVRAGSNDVAIVVMRWSAHSYVEDQDQWWMAGLHRTVYVEARGAVHLASLVCDAGLRAAGTSEPVGTLVASATLEGLAPPGRGWQVRFAVETAARPAPRTCPDGRRSTSVRNALPVPRPHRGRVVRVARGRSVVGRIAGPLSGDRGADRSRRRRGRGPRSARRLPLGRGARSPTPRERRADLGVRRQPPRSSSDPRQGGDDRRHARRPARDAAPQHHRGAVFALSERSCLPRPVRRDRDVRRRRGEHRESRLQHQPVRRRKVPLGVVVQGSADDRARPESSERDHVVARQRGRLRQQPRRARRMDAARRSVATAALRGGGVPRRMGRRWQGGQRRGVPDVPDDRLDCRVRPSGRRRSTTDHVRVQPCDGQLQRLARRLLGRDHDHARASRADSSGNGRTTVCSRGCPAGSGDLPTAASSATSPTTGTSSPTA